MSHVLGSEFIVLLHNCYYNKNIDPRLKSPNDLFSWHFALFMSIFFVYFICHRIAAVLCKQLQAISSEFHIDCVTTWIPQRGQSIVEDVNKAQKIWLQGILSLCEFHLNFHNLVHHSARKIKLTCSCKWPKNWNYSNTRKL